MSALAELQALRLTRSGVNRLHCIVRLVVGLSWRSCPGERRTRECPLWYPVAVWIRPKAVRRVWATPPGDQLMASRALLPQIHC